MRAIENSICVRQEQRPLVYRVVAFHIKCWITFSEAKLLGQYESLFEVELLFKHFRENKIGGTINDSLHRVKEVVVVIFFQISYNGYGGAGCSYVEKRFARCLLHFENFCKVFRKHFFTCAYNSFSVPDGLRYYLESSFGVVNHLHDHIYVGIIEQFIFFGGEKFFRGVSFFAGVLDTDFFDRSVEGRCLVHYFI